MGIFDKFFRSKSSQAPPTGAEILKLLLNATKSQDQSQFENLCNQHRDLIRQSYPNWKTVTAEYRNREASEHYVNMMLAVAEYFQEKGDASLMKILDVGEADDMFDRWGKTLEYASQLNGEEKHNDALVILGELENELKPLIGSASDKAMAVLHGRKGQAYLGKGELEQARTFLMLGYHACQKIGNINELILITQDLAELAKSKGLAEEERHWRVVMTNILIQVGNPDGAIAVRKYFGIEPFDELIETNFEVGQ